jgi:hypothetical protein
MKETMESAVSLPEDNPAAFNIMAEWMYGTEVTFGRKPEDLVTAYNLADKLCMPQLQNAIADHLRLRKPLPSPNNASWVWKNLPDGSPLRQLILDQTHYLMTTDLAYKPGVSGTDATKAMLVEVMMRSNTELARALFWKAVDHGKLQGFRDPTPPSKLIGCHYHIHEDGKKCK